ncbi:MAG: ABC transporter permease [Myxococcota bacterium]|nr:ABC transporter permease [Myxococcota bacterium]
MIVRPNHRLRNGGLILASTTIFLLLAWALLGPWILDVSKESASVMVANPYEPPSTRHWLGTNALGQDAFALLLLGMRTSLLVGICAGLIATVLGSIIGILSGFKGGVLDNILTAITDLIVVVPQLLVLILLCNSIDDRSYLLLTLFIGATSWTWVARSLRTQAASLRNRAHVDLARLNGLGTVTILRTQILPYVSSYVFMAFVMQLGSGIFAESALSMLGLGPRGAEAISLGSILHLAAETGAYTDGIWWIFLPPIAVITTAVYSLYLMNASLEMTFNPRMRNN